MPKVHTVPYKRYLVLIALALAIGYSARTLFVFPRWTVDDAYITFRYAENLALHGALTWNLGGDPVEGYTGVLLPIILAGLIRLGVEPILGSWMVGVLAYWAELLL